MYSRKPLIRCIAGVRGPSGPDESPPSSVQYGLLQRLLKGAATLLVVSLKETGRSIGLKFLKRQAPAPAGTMDSEAFQSARDFLDMNFQSLAMKHMDLKQMELDTAAAKVDELTKQLESLWSDSPTPPGPQAGPPSRPPRYSSSSIPEPFGSRGSPRKAATDGADTPFGRSESAPTLHPYSPLSPKGRPSSPRTPLYLQPDAYGSLDRATSPRPRAFDGAGSSLGRAPSPRPGPGPLRQQGPPTPFDFLGRAGSPRGSPLAEGPQAFFPERGPSPRPSATAYDAPASAFGSSLLGSGGSAFAPPLRAQDDLTLRRRPPKAWNESDLDVAYEKKPSQTASYERLDVFARPASPSLQLLPWRESSLDGLGGTGKDNLTSATLPRNYKVSPLASDRRSDAGSYRRSLGSAGPSGTLPRSWQPVSRIPMPPSSPQPRGAPRQRPIPLSMIFKLQNAFWEHGASRAMLPGSPLFTRAPPPKLQPQPQPQPQPQSQPQPQLPPQPQPQPQTPTPAPQHPQQTWPLVNEGPPKPPTELEPEPEIEGLLTPVLEAGDVDEGPVARPLSPTRLQPALPPEAQSVPELEEVARVLAEIPRPLKRRGSMEQAPAVALPPTHKKQYQQIISRLFHRHGGPGPGGPEPELSPITEGSEARAGPPAPAPPAPIPPPAPSQSSPPEQLQSMGTGGSRRSKAPPHPIPRESQFYPCLGDALGAAEGGLPAQGPPRAPQPSGAPPGRGADRGAGGGAAGGEGDERPEPAQRGGHHCLAQRHLRRQLLHRGFPHHRGCQCQLPRQPRLDTLALRGVVQRHSHLHGAGAARRCNLRHHAQRRRHRLREVRPLPRGLC
nr:relA-associated inhibitor isoform X2 [Gorilla gorilla gorilla]